MTIFKKRRVRKARKELKDVLHHAKHIRHMHEDIADPKALEQLRAIEKAAREARGGAAFAKGSGGPGGDRVDLMETAGAALIKACEKVAPPRRHPKTRENVEVLFVAIAAAMAIHAYFFQPFRIPTGSMQPTLYGITLQENSALPPTNPLFRAVNLIFFGEKQEPVVKAKASGYIQTAFDKDGHRKLYAQPNPDETVTIYIGGIPHRVPFKFLQKNLLRIGEKIRVGEPVARSSVRKSGDYILVNRIKYNFVRPKRGDIAVFDTRALTHPTVRKDSYYIKRMVGLPGETISVDPKYLLVNGGKPNDPRFDKIFNNENYNGYQFGNPLAVPTPLLSQSGDSITLENDEYLFFGDNTGRSLDGRFFGGVKRKYIKGPAFFVCWPLDRAGFAETSH